MYLDVAASDMGFHAFSHSSLETDSEQAALDAARALLEAFTDHPLKIALVYATTNHDHLVLLATLRAALPPQVILLGCSVQGVVAQGMAREGGFTLGVMGLGGELLRPALAFERDFQVNTEEKGRALGASLKASLGEDPKLALLIWDPLCGADVERLLAGLSEQISCPIVGGGAGQPFGRVVRTYQYIGGEVTQHVALALGLSGDFSAEIGVCHGTSPSGIRMTLNRSEGNRLLEIDGQPAVSSWREVTGSGEGQLGDQDLSHWAIGVERIVKNPDGSQASMYFVRAAFNLELETGAVIVPAAIPEGTKIMFHHRTAAAVTEGTSVMGRDLAARLNGQRPWAVLGFECGARTSPFLGSAATLAENLELQRLVAPGAPWLGMMAWGEVAPVGGVATFHNYTYPLVVFRA